MKYLEYIRLVQFFLYDKQDIRVSEITGIFGPNGSGKSSLIDAVQIAMLGANHNYMALNAQADERRTTRSVREYCLGQYGESQDHRTRDAATTYVTLVWRDSETSEPTSMGVCLYASADQDGHTVLGRYVIRGVNLQLGDHLEVVDDNERPRDWKTFKHQLIQRSKHQDDEVIFGDAGRYIRAALLALRGSGGAPVPEPFARAFQFALRMRFDKEVDHIVRNDVLEPRPTNIKKFKEVMESFRHFSELIQQVQDKIDGGERVAAEYEKAFEESKRVVMWGILSKMATLEVLTEALDKASQEKENAEAALKNLEIEQREVWNNISLATDEALRYRRLREAHSAHKDYGLIQTEIKTANNKASEKRQFLNAHLTSVLEIIKKANQDEELKPLSNRLQAALDDISYLMEHSDSISKKQIEEKLQAVLATAKAALDISQLVENRADQKLNEARERLSTLDSALSRISTGKAPLDESVQRLLTKLEDNGLNPIPVCDLVRITDATWQPVIESYLNRNLQALLIPSVQEEHAFKIYRGMGSAVYGVKLARESRQQIGKIYEHGTVAELIEGENLAAVAYLRKQFGNLLRATSDKEALAGHRTLTKDGMLSGDDIDRLRPIPQERFRIGITSKNHREEIKREHDALKKEVETLERLKNKYSIRTKALGHIANNEQVVQFVVQTWKDMSDAIRDARDRANVLKNSGNEEYAKLSEAEQACEQTAANLQPEKDRLISAITNANTALNTCITIETNTKNERDIASNNLDAAREDTLYDNQTTLKQWELSLQQYNNQYRDMVAFFAKKQEVSSSSMNAAANRGSKELGIFIQKHGEQCPPNINGDWGKEREWLLDLLKRLHDTQLVPYKEEMTRAYLASQETFRTDVAIALDENLKWLQETMSRLNAVLRECPPFTYGERYHFIRRKRLQYESLLKFIEDVATHGPRGDLLGGPGEMPEEFKQLLEDKLAPGAAGVRSPLDDYREFFEFDIEILREDPVSKISKVVGHLSKRLGHGSGGEHRAPLYVIAGAALASAYRLDRGHINGPRLMLLDEAFDKMDPTNIIATVRYLQELNLQVLMASPGENLGTLNAFLHNYYDILKDPDNNIIFVEEHTVSPEVRVMFREDLPEFNPTLIDQQVSAMRAASSGKNGGSVVQ